VKKNTEGRDRNKLKWDNIKYAPGYLEAVAKTNGKVVARHRIETTGKAVALKVVPDNANWKADGMDLQHLRVVAVDKKGRRVLGAEQQLTFAIEGDAKIVAVDNGNIVSDEMHVSHQRKLFKGSAMIILRAGQTPGEITLITEGEGFKKVKTKLQTY